MGKKFGLVFRTLKSLKFIQLFFQIYYRIKPKKGLETYLAKDFDKIRFTGLKFIFDLPYVDLLDENLSFKFLNRKKSFQQKVDWNFQEYGKLWNYNLQYFNFLHQDNLNNTIKEQLLFSITSDLKQHNVKLEPYPVSLRVMNTIRHYAANPSENPEVMAGLYGQLNYLNNNLEFHLLGNHLLENGFALIMGGAAFNNDAWIKKAEKLLLKELNEQILNDGGHFELSPMYHQIILFRVVELIEWYSEYEKLDPTFLGFLKDKAALMVSWLKHMTFKNGDIPHLNDSAPNIAFTSAQLLKFAAALDLDQVNVPLKDSGYRKYQGDDYELILDCAELGPIYQSGHSHSDCLSFVLYKSNKPFIVDLGTSTYNIGKKRNEERSTDAHNTVSIENRNQSEVWGGFRVGKRANAKIITESASHFEGQHTGYQQEFATVHRRRFDFSDNQVIIHDTIGKVKGKLSMHFHPRIKCTLSPDGTVLIDDFAIISFSTSNQPLLLPYEFADGFNNYEKAYKIEFEFEGKIETSIKFLSAGK